MSVVDIARKYIGQTEKPGNAGFSDAEFEIRMKAVGFQKGHAWCSYFAELCFKEAYPEKELDKLFSASAVQTFKNFKDAGYPVDLIPEAGKLVIWQNMTQGIPQWSGHVGIVTVVMANCFSTIEGNTNDSGGREGIEVAEKVRTLNRKHTGLNVLGFITI